MAAFATWGNSVVEPDEGKGISSCAFFFVRSEARRTTAAITA
jgi:hypothetical protein